MFGKNGSTEGLVFFLVKLLAFIWLGVKLCKMPRESGANQELAARELQKGEKLFYIGIIGFFLLTWARLALLSYQGSFLVGILSVLRLLMLVYIVVWPVGLGRKSV